MTALGLQLSPMNAPESECLSQDDFRLFHKGACHVFAETLASTLKSEEYALGRVVLKKGFDLVQAYHVVAIKGAYVVDAGGIKRTDDYVAWLTAKHQEKSFGKVVIPSVEIQSVGGDELLKHDHDDAYLGHVNRWNLFAGKEFVEAAHKRAVALINHWPEKYCVSVLEAGQKVRQAGQA